MPNISRNKDNQTMKFGQLIEYNSRNTLIEKITQKMWWRNYNPGQNIWNKIEKSSKTEENEKSFISTFACFLTAIAKVWFLERTKLQRPLAFTSYQAF